MKFDNPTSFNIVQSGNLSLDGHGCCWIRYKRFIKPFVRRWTTFVRNVGCAQAQLGRPLELSPCGHCTENSHAALTEQCWVCLNVPVQHCPTSANIVGSRNNIFKYYWCFLKQSFLVGELTTALEHFKIFTETAISNSQVNLLTVSSFKYLFQRLPAESYVRAISVHFH